VPLWANGQLDSLVFPAAAAELDRATSAELLLRPGRTP